MYADVILPLPLSDLYTYSVPVAMQGKIAKGVRVIVPFGIKKHYTAIVVKLHENKPIGFETKDIHSLVDTQPVVNDKQLNLWEWISFYYMSPFGDVYNAAMPASMKSNDTKTNFKPKTETYFKINTLLDIDSTPDIFGRSKKQPSLYNQLTTYIKEKGTNLVSREEMIGLENYSVAILKGLLQKEIVVSHIKETGRINNDLKPTRNPYPLSETQQETLNEVNRVFETKPTCLLHGVTSSGKTE